MGSRKFRFWPELLRFQLKSDQWAEPESNRRHMDFQSIALPAELSARNRSGNFRPDGEVCKQSLIRLTRPIGRDTIALYASGGGSLFYSTLLSGIARRLQPKSAHAKPSADAGNRALGKIPAFVAIAFAISNARLV